MKFDMLFPNVNPDDSYDYNGSDYIVDSLSSGPCLVCKEATRWIDLNFEAYLCSTECEDALWAEYDGASNRSNHVH